jgi:hypothetical protein
MELRDRGDVESRRERVLVIHAQSRYTRPVADALAHELSRDGFTVEIADADTRAAPPPADYDAIVIGSRVRFGGHARAIVDYIAHHREALATMPAFLFAVSRDGHAHVGRLRRATGWLPTRSFGIARPAWHVRWFGDPNAERAPRVHELALAIGEEVPALAS